MDGGAGDEAHHFVEEAIAHIGDAVAVRQGFEIGAVDGAVPIHIGRFIATVGGEGVEIVPAGEERQRLFQRGGIQQARKVPGEACLERWQHGIRADIVMIDFPDGREPAVEIRGHFLAGHHADGGRQLAIECRHPIERVHGNFRRGVEVRRLRQCVDSGIGAAGTLQPQRLLGHLFEGAVQEILHGVAAGLRLPSVVGPPVVGDG